MAPLRLKNIKACVFDAYGTLFDVNAAARAEQASLGDKWLEIADIWRLKQLQYTWLRSLQSLIVNCAAIMSDLRRRGGVMRSGLLGKHAFNDSNSLSKGI